MPVKEMKKIKRTRKHKYVGLLKCKSGSIKISGHTRKTSLDPTTDVSREFGRDKGNDDPYKGK